MTAAADSPPPGPAAHPYRWTMLAGAWLIYYCFGLTTVVMAPLVGTITEELGLSHSAMGSVLGAWPLVYIASAVPCGAFLDRFGVRRALFLGAIIMALSGALRALAVDHASLFGAVAVFGLGGPLISIGAPKLVSLWFEGRERGLAMGIYVTGPALGGITSLSLTNSVMMPLAGGNWRWVLLAYAAFVAGSGIAWLAVSAHRASRAAERAAAEEPRRRQLQVFARLLGLRVVRIVLVMSIGIFFFNHALNNWLPEILRSGGMDASSAGYWASIPVAVSIAAALVVPHLAVPSRRLAILVSLFACAGAAALLIQGATGPGLAAGLILHGIARGALIVILVLVLMESREVGSRNMGAAGGLFFSAAEIGGVLGPLTIGLVYDLSGGFAAGLFLLAGVCAALMVLVRALRPAAGGESPPA